jgi:hypothetical protein
MHAKHYVDLKFMQPLRLHAITSPAMPLPRHWMLVMMLIGVFAVINTSVVDVLSDAAALRLEPSLASYAATAYVNTLDLHMRSRAPDIEAECAKAMATVDFESESAPKSNVLASRADEVATISRVCMMTLVIDEPLAVSQVKHTGSTPLWKSMPQSTQDTLTTYLAKRTAAATHVFAGSLTERMSDDNHIVDGQTVKAITAKGTKCAFL